MPNKKEDVYVPLNRAGKLISVVEEDFPEYVSDARFVSMKDKLATVRNKLGTSAVITTDLRQELGELHDLIGFFAEKLKGDIDKEAKDSSGVTNA